MKSHRKGDPPARHRESSKAWAVVLAAGRGSRLQVLTRCSDDTVPKQYCALRGNETMLRWALDRALGVVPRQRLVTIVGREHARWWRPELAALPEGNRIVQPADRGTAAGILLPLLEIARRDPEATVLVLPSDHFVEREWIFQVAMLQAVLAVSEQPERVLLLGVAPDAPAPGLGWVVPGPRARGRSWSEVEEFREKPAAEETCRLLARGALVNTFVFAARVSTLLELYRRWLPQVLDLLEGGGTDDAESLAAIYDRLPVRDFSRDLLQPAARQLGVLGVPPCGWDDLGTPDRVARCLESWRGESRPGSRSLPAGFVAPLELASRLTVA